MKLREFDLEAALRGEPVVTRDGRAVTQLTIFDFISNKKLIGVIEGKNFVDEWRLDGSIGGYTGDYVDNIHLFMAPKIKKLFIGILKNPSEALEKKGHITTAALENINELKIFLDNDLKNYIIKEIEIEI